MDKPDDIPQDVWYAAGLSIDDLDELVDFSNDGRILSKYMDKQYSSCQSVIAKAILKAKNDAYEEAAAMIEQGYERPVAKPWSANGASKNDLCPHGMAVYQDCEQCAADAIRNLKHEG